MQPAVRLFYHTVLLSLMVGWAFIWLKTPSLSPYALQLFGVSVLSYFVIKKINKADFWQLLPSPLSLEMAAATLAFLLVIGATGNLHSPLFALTFIHLFFLALSAHTITALIVTVEIMLFHYGLAPDITALEISSLLSVAIVMGFFLLVKDQFLKVFKQQIALNESLQKISQLKAADQAFEQLLTHVLGKRGTKAAAASVASVVTVTPTVDSVDPLDLAADAAHHSTLQATPAEPQVTEITAVTQITVSPAEPMPEVDLPEIDELLTEALESSRVTSSLSDRTSQLLADDILKTLG